MLDLALFGCGFVGYGFVSKLKLKEEKPLYPKSHCMLVQITFLSDLIKMQAAYWWGNIVQLFPLLPSNPAMCLLPWVSNAFQIPSAVILAEHPSSCGSPCRFLGFYFFLF